MKRTFIWAYRTGPCLIQLWYEPETEQWVCVVIDNTDIFNVYPKKNAYFFDMMSSVMRLMQDYSEHTGDKGYYVGMETPDNHPNLNKVNKVVVV
jgi:hypothetical protein